MGGAGVTVVPAGGGANDALGVDAASVATSIEAADGGDGVVVVCDLGSSILSTRTALELVERDARLADAPLVEGAIAAAVVASTGADLDDVVAAAEGARGATKL